MIETKSGIIETIMLRKHYGFIRQEDGPDMFFHKSGVLSKFEDLREGMPVEYMVVDYPGGIKAIGLVAT